MPIRSLSLPIPLLLLAAWMMCCAASATAGDTKPPPPPATLVGQSFAISFLAEKGKPKDKLTFAADGATAKALGENPIKVTYSTKPRHKDVDFTGKSTDAAGTVTEVSGVAAANDIHGTITITAKDEDPKARNFTGVRTDGAPPAGEKDKKK